MDRSDSLLITGSSGFVGLSFLDFLTTLPAAQLPSRLGLVSRSGKFGIPETLQSSTEIISIQADLRTSWDFEFNATKILHLAADGSKSAYSEEAAQDFVAMTKHLRDWAGKQGQPTVFHASSGACYGYFPLVHSTKSEGELLSSPKDVFIQHRIAAENVLREAHLEGVIDLRIGRLFSFIGPHIREKPHYAIPNFVASALNGNQVIVNGDPATVRSYLDSEDMSEWIYRSFSEGTSSETLDIGSEAPVTMREIAEFVASRTNSEVIYNRPVSAGDRYVAKNFETRSRLGVSETRTWQTSLDRYIAFARGR